MRRVDVAIVGGGPAGSATAIHLGGHGLQVALLDKAQFPRDTICGEALSPGALPFLESFGLLEAVRAEGAFPFRGARLGLSDGLAAEARYPDSRYGLALPRERLDWLLINQAAQTAQLLDGVGVDAIQPDGPGHRLSLKTSRSRDMLWARAVVLASGRFTRLLTAPIRDPGPASRFAVVATLEGVSALSEFLELHLLEARTQVVVSAQSPQKAAIALVLDGPDAPARASAAVKDFLAALRRDPLLAGRLAQAKLCKAPRGMGLGRYRPLGLAGPGWLAVGDAVGFMDPLTGEGMYRAFRTAQLAAETLLSTWNQDLGPEAFKPYILAVRRELEPSVRFVDTVVALSRRPELARYAIRAIARDPVLAARIGAYQGAIASARGFFSLGTLARFVWAGRP